MNFLMYLSPLLWEGMTTSWVAGVSPHSFFSDCEEGENGWGDADNR